MRPAFLLAAALLVAVPGMWAQQGSDEKSPDQQQQAHPQNLPPPSANAPNASETDTAHNTARKHKKVRQAHGTPAPSTTQSTATH